MAQVLVGCDVGHRVVRAVALKRSRTGYAVAGSAMVRRHADDGQERPLAAVLGELKQRLPLGSEPVVAISQVASLVRYVSTAPMPKDRLERILRLEMQQHVESGELAADTFTVPVDGEEMRHCCILAQSGQIRAALADFTVAKQEVGSLHFGPAALLNTALVVSPVEGTSLALLVDIGAQTTSVSLVGDGRLLACRQLPSGGQQFTDALATARGVTAELAEAWKLGGVPAASTSDSTSSGIAFAPFAALARPAAPTTDVVATLPVEVVADPVDVTAAVPLSFEIDSGSPVIAPTAPIPTTVSAVVAPALFAPAVVKTGPDEDLALFDDEPAPPVAEAIPVGKSAVESTDWLPELVVPTVESTLIAELSGPSASLTDVKSPRPFDPFAVPDSPPQPPPGRATMAIAMHQLGPEMTKPAEMLFGQLSSSIAWFKTQLGLADLAIAKVLLSGGGAGLVGLEQYLTRRFGVPVERQDPFVGMTGEIPAAPYEYATVVGLALAAEGGPTAARRLELLPEGILKQRLWRDRLVWPFVAAGLVVVAGAILGWTMLSEQSVEAESLEALNRFASAHKQKMAQITQVGQEREALCEDIRAIAGRIYAARDVLLTIRALKEQTERSKELWVARLETVDVGSDGEVTVDGRRIAKPKPRIKDTAIDRGGVLISGFVKFDASKSDQEFTEFFDKWRLAILDWRPSEVRPRLFQDKRDVTIFNVKHEKNQEGRVPFQVKFFYLPTDLSQITAQEVLEKPSPDVRR